MRLRGGRKGWKRSRLLELKKRKKEKKGISKEREGNYRKGTKEGKRRKRSTGMKRMGKRERGKQGRKGEKKKERKS